MTNGPTTEALGPARARMDGIRRALAATTDAEARARLRLRLADALAAGGDSAGAVTELKQAAAESPASAGLALGAWVLAPRLPPEEARLLLEVVPLGRSARSAGGPAGPAGRGAVAPRPRVAGVSAATPAPTPVLPAPIPSVSPSLEGAGSLPTDLIDLAFAALAAGKPVRARRLGEEVARAAELDAGRLRQLHDLGDAIEGSGARREALYLARTLEETVEAGTTAAPARAAEALAAIVARALEAGDVDLALRWGADLGRPIARLSRPAPGPRDEATASFPARFRAAQRASLGVATEDDAAAVIELLEPLLVSEAVAGAALELALELAERLGPQAAARRAELLRAAFEGERTPLGRARLAARWLEAVETAGDAGAGAAAAALDRAIDEMAPIETAGLRKLRVELLSRLGWSTELIRALASDAEVAAGSERAALLSRQADTLDRLGEPDRALEVRLAALADGPGDERLLAPARRRFEAVGQLERSLDLAAAALPHIRARETRIIYLRDIATLSEATAGDRARAAAAWLELLALAPDDVAAAEAAERLLRATGDQKALGEHLAWSAARQSDPQARSAVLWRLAEFRLQEQQRPAALALYREIIAARGGVRDAALVRDEDWQRRDDLLALHSARALAAPDAPARARAVTDRALILIEAGRLDEADRDLERALDQDPAVPNLVDALELLYERRGDWRGMRHRLQSRVAAVSGPDAARLWFGIGRANERLGDAEAAGTAYTRAGAADEAYRPALVALRRLATGRGDWTELGRLTEREIDLARAPAERVELLIELGVLLAEKLARPARAVETLDAALAFQPANPRALDAMISVALAAGAWEKAGQALEARLTAGGPIVDAADRYFKIGQAAEAAGQLDRALGFYSRSYARNQAYRPTLERLSDICFQRQQWDNAWKATEHLIEMHGAEIEPDARAELSLRSALADLHVAQRIAAANQIARQSGMPASGAGLRDVAESWASMRFDPRLLGGIDGERRGRVLSRLADVAALTERTPAHPAREAARETWTALAMVEHRWADAVEALDAFCADVTLEVRKRAVFAVAAGDILLYQQGDVVGAALRYERARALNPGEPRLARPSIVQVAANDDPTDENEIHEISDDVGPPPSSFPHK